MCQQPAGPPAARRAQAAGQGPAGAEADPRSRVQELASARRQGPGSIQVTGEARTAGWRRNVCLTRKSSFLLLVRDITAAVLGGQDPLRFRGPTPRTNCRTPLTVLTGYLESMAEDEEFPDRWDDPVQHMASQCDRMTRLVRDLLELSRLETSETPPGFAPLNMMDVLGDAVQVATARSNGRLDIRAEVKSERPLLGDEAEIRSVATNLAINSVAFTPPGGEVVLRWQAGGSRRTAFGCRHRHRHPAGAPSPAYRAVLPRARRRQSRGSGNRSGTGDCQACAGASRGQPGDRKQAREGKHVHLPLPPPSASATRRSAHRTPARPFASR